MPWGICRSWSCCFLSLAGGRKHSLYLQPHRPRAAGKPTGTSQAPTEQPRALQRCGAIRPQNSLQKLHQAPFIAGIRLRGRLLPNAFCLPESDREAENLFTWLGHEGIKKGEGKKGFWSAPATLHPSREHPNGMDHSGEYWCSMLGPSLTSSISVQTEALQMTLSPAKPPPGWLGDSPGRSWLLQSGDKASGQGGAAGMQTNSSSKVQAVPGADGSTDSSGSLCHNRCPVTLTINRGALQGQPCGPVPSCPAPLGAREDILKTDPVWHLEPPRGGHRGGHNSGPGDCFLTRFSTPPPAFGTWTGCLTLPHPQAGIRHSSWGAS